ncbi:hypothetical protein HDV00_002139 [Rhizophlyctis rosea]|nr:hypothetical protein HDV00_002139 [Rhizophlyctis rosea]
MAQPDLSALFATLKQAEDYWFANLSPSDVNTLTRNGSILADSHYYGEIAFCILGLKPAVLIHFLQSNALTDRYVADVIQKSRAALSGTPYALEVQRVDTPLRSVHTETFLGSYILYSQTAAPSIQQVIQSTFFTNPSPTPIPESALATILDYPGSLPTSDTDALQNGFCEVVYFDITKPFEKVLITTYGARPWERQKVLAHFQRYKQAVESLSMNLDMDIVV